MENLVNHDQVVAEIMRRAAARGVLSHYCKRGERCEGDPGLPDIVLPGGWLEVKTPACPTLSSGQKRWRYALIGAGQVHEVMFERDLAPGGGVDMFLEFLSEGRML
jgi:hypothetical protein